MTALSIQLIIGNYGLSYEQSKSQMALWAILAAPLIMSHDPRTIRPEFRDILLNADVIRVNQDALGIQGKRVYVVRNYIFFGDNVTWSVLLIRWDKSDEQHRNLDQTHRARGGRQ